MTLEDIKNEVEMMQAEAKVVLPKTGDKCVERATVLAAYHARVGELYAEAKYLVNKKKSSEIANEVVKIAKAGYLAANAQNAMVNSLAKEEQKMVDALDRLNSAFAKQMDLCRTFISKEKAEMQYLNFNASKDKHGTF